MHHLFHGQLARLENSGYGGQGYLIDHDVCALAMGNYPSFPAHIAAASSFYSICGCHESALRWQGT